MITFQEFFESQKHLMLNKGFSKKDPFERVKRTLARSHARIGDDSVHSQVYGDRRGHGYDVKMITRFNTRNFGSENVGGKLKPAHSKLRFFRLAHENQDNIHFPRIHKSTDYASNQKGLTGFNVSHIERLHELKDAEPHEIEALHNSVFHEDPMFQPTIFSLSRKVGRAATDDWYRDKSVHSGQFKDALSKIQELHRTRTSGIGVDLHSGNMMIRRTKFGNQLVITDPLA